MRELLTSVVLAVISVYPDAMFVCERRRLLCNIQDKLRSLSKWNIFVDMNLDGEIDLEPHWNVYWNQIHEIIFETFGSAPLFTLDFFFE